MAISSMTRTCPHCAEPMFLVNLERDAHDQLRLYKCLNCNQTSQFARVSEATTLWLDPAKRSRGDGPQYPAPDT